MMSKNQRENLWAYEKRLAFVQGVIRNNFPSKDPATIQILDVGCGNGSQLSLRLAHLGFDVTGIDPDDSSIAHALRLAENTPQARFLRASVEDVEDTFDVVILSEVLEHVKEPETLLRAAVRLLKPPGIVIVTTPNGFGEFEIDSWLFRVFGMRHIVDRFATKESRTIASTDNDHSCHVQFFTRGRLYRIFRECGLAVWREGAASLFAGPFAGHSLARSSRFISWNARVTDRLPMSLASGWYFALRFAKQSESQSEANRVKIVLVVLTGDAKQAHETLTKEYPEATIEIIPRSEIEVGSLPARLARLRARRPAVFVIATERLEWQRGQDLFMLFGAMAGAQTLVMLDAHGGVRCESRAQVLRRSPERLLQTTASSAGILARAKRELRNLEAEMQNGGSVPCCERQSNGQSKTQIQIVYLRATPGPGTQTGGAATHINGVAEGLLSLGAELRMVSNDAIAGLDEQKVPLTIVPPEPRGGSRALFEIHNNNVFTRGALPLIESDPPDFIYQRYARFGWAGVIASRRTKRPLFLEYNGSEVWVGRHWDQVGMLQMLEHYERLNLAAASRIFVVSEVERRNLERTGIRPDRIIVNPNGVDTEIFRPNIGGDEIRKHLEILDDETLIGFVSTFGPWHGVLTLVDAIRAIPAASRARFLLVGSGSLHAKAKQGLQAEEQKGQVIFTGSVEHLQVPALLDACDVLVSPHVPLSDGSEFFGSPTKIFEYMAMSKGIVASRLGQIGEVLRNEETALLVEPGNAQQLSAAIVRLAEAKTLRDCLGAAARQVAIKHHTWKRNAQVVLDTYRAWLEE